MNPFAGENAKVKLVFKQYFLNFFASSGKYEKRGTELRDTKGLQNV